MLDSFLSYLVENQILSPQQLISVRNLLVSPRYIVLQAVWLDCLEPEQLKQALSSAATGGGRFDIKAIPPDALKRIREEMSRSTRLAEQIIIDLGIVGGEELKKLIAGFSATEKEKKKQTAGAPENALPLKVFISTADTEVRQTLQGHLSDGGHEVSYFSSSIEAEAEAKSADIDYLISDISVEGIMGLEAISRLLSGKRALSAAAISTGVEDYSVPEGLAGNPQFVFEEKDRYLGRLDFYIDKVSGFKAALREKKRPAKQSPVAADARLVAEWMNSVDIQYTPAGVTLYIDRAKVPAVKDRYKLTPSESATHKAFHDAVMEKIRGLRIEQLDTQHIELCVWYPWSVPVTIAPAQAPTRDASFKIGLSRNGNQVLMHFFPASGKGAGLRKDEVLRQISVAAPEFYIKPETVDRLLASKQELRRISVAERRDAEVDIELSGDETEAYMTLRRPYGGAMVKPEDIIAMAGAIGITTGLDRDIIESSCFSASWDKGILIAHGRAVKHGADGRFELLFSEEGPAARDDEKKKSGDPRRIKIFNKVYEGESIAKIIAPERGVSGINVRGEEVAARQGRPVAIAFAGAGDKTAADILLGENVTVAEKGRYVNAARDGLVHWDGKRISVSEVFDVKGDVDFSVGNIDVIGDVIIKGNVLSKFQVKATGDVYIGGTVEDAIIECGGKLVVEQGIFGNKKAIVYAAESIETSCIEQATVLCLGEITAKRSIAHSFVAAGHSVDITDNEGFLVGGHTKAGQFVSAAKLGSQAGTATLIEVGSRLNIMEEMDNARAALIARISGAPARTTQKTDDSAHTDRNGDPGTTKTSAQSVKSHDRMFVEWIDIWIEKNRNRAIVSPYPRKDSRIRIIGKNFTYPGVSLKTSFFNFNVRNELAGQRVFNVTGDKIVETT